MRALALVILVACDAPPSHELPGVAVAPQLRSPTPATACGTDIASADGEIALRYRYSYDALGRLVYARGIYADSRYEDTIEYRFDNLDRMAQLVQTGWDGTSVKIDALYTTLGDLVEYTWSEQGALERHTYTAFDAAGKPAREVVTVQGRDLAFALHYDALGRLALVAAEGEGLSTIYSYDDDARTITIDTEHGAYRSVSTYDDDNRLLSEHWDGSDPSVIAGEQVFEWEGDRLQKMTYRAGSERAPHALRVVQIETYRYHCAP